MAETNLLYSISSLYFFFCPRTDLAIFEFQNLDSVLGTFLVTTHSTFPPLPLPSLASLSML